ncbi:hypothetical protein EDB83DRAFT_696940 [Lactarius deliciosus]|nr:hypothetical protein EDB83DRAFT_696940 [Lactarius deliciosus]
MEDALTSRNHRTETANGSRPEPRVCAYRQGAQHQSTHSRSPASSARSPTPSPTPRPCRCHCRACILEATSQSSPGAHNHWMVQSLAASTSILHPRRHHCPSRRWGAVDERTSYAGAETSRADAVPALLCQWHGHAWRVRNGDAFGALLYVLELGGCAGRICAVCVPQVGGFYSKLECDFFFRVLMLSLCSSTIHRFVRVQQ